MKRIVYLFITVLFCSMAKAQPESWAKKAAKSLFTVKTFDANGALIGSGCGFFISENGNAVCNFAPFNGAAKAIVIDAAGKEYPVDYIIGASQDYDIAKLHVNTKKCMPLEVTDGAMSNSKMWLLPYALKNPQTLEGTVEKVEKVASDYDYYTIAMAAAPENAVGCPLLNTQGQVVGILQAGGSDGKQYAVSARMASDMKATGLSANDPTLKLTSIKKALPDDAQEALVALYVCSATLDSLAMNAIVDDYVAKFPSSVDGYVYRATRAFSGFDFASADADMQLAVKLGDKKDDAHYNYAKMILDKVVYLADKPFEAWTLDKANAEIDAAIAVQPLPAYRQLKAQVVFAQTNYSESAAIYQSLIGEGSQTAENYFGIARCREMLNDTTACLAMLDSAVATFSRPYLKEAAPYILARGQMMMNCGKYRQAVNDFNDYEQLMVTLVNDNFYYLRSQAEAKGRLFKQALDDLKKASSINPSNTLYLAERASLELRVGLNDDAIATSNEILQLDSTLSDGYLFLGIAQCVKGQKEEGLKNLRKAKDLGDSQAQTFIDKYSK